MGVEVGVTEPGTAVATRNPNAIGGVLRPLAQPHELLEVQNETRAMIAATLQEGRDYGLIPGTKDKSLLQPGAERVNMAMGVYPRCRVLQAEVDHHLEFFWVKSKRVYNNAHPGDNSYTEQKVRGESIGLYRYIVECELVHRDTGLIVGSAIASCSTMESKYIDRPRESENTVLQMAEKRAYVRATRTTYGLSDEFTQDMEDASGDQVRTRRKPAQQQQGEPQRQTSTNVMTKDQFLDSVAPGAKPNGRTWRSMINEDRGWVRWAIGGNGVGGMKKLNDQQRGWLTEQCDAVKETGQPARAGNGDADPTPADLRKQLELVLQKAVEIGAITRDIASKAVRWSHSEPTPAPSEWQKTIASIKVKIAHREEELKNAPQTDALPWEVPGKAPAAAPAGGFDPNSDPFA
jgi:hypothetical protein